nr:hypothetical protein CFP56_75514 [Quercus suber]
MTVLRSLCASNKSPAGVSDRGFRQSRKEDESGWFVVSQMEIHIYTFTKRLLIRVIVDRISIRHITSP